MPNIRDVLGIAMQLRLHMTNLPTNIYFQIVELKERTILRGQVWQSVSVSLLNFRILWTEMKKVIAK